MWTVRVVSIGYSGYSGYSGLVYSGYLTWTVRVVSIGPTIDELLAEPTKPEWEAYSIELCGGTHIGETQHTLHP